MNSAPFGGHRGQAFPASPHNRDQGRAASWRAKRSLRCADNEAGGDWICPVSDKRDEARPWRRESASSKTVSARAGAGVRGTTEAGQKVPTQEWPRSRAPRPALPRAVQREHAAEGSRRRDGVAGRGRRRRHRSATRRMPRVRSLRDRRARAAVRNSQCTWSPRLFSRASGHLVPPTAYVAPGWAAPANLDFRSRGKVFRFQSNAICVTPGLPEIAEGGPVR